VSSGCENSGAAVVLRFGFFSSSSQALHERRMVDLWWLPVAALGAAGGVVLLRLVARDETVGGLSLENFLAVVVAWSFIASGLIAWRAGPEVRLGRLMVGTGFAVLAAPLLQYVSSPLLATVGVGVALFWLIFFVWFLLSVPDRRLSSRWDRALLAPFLVALIPLQVLWLLFWVPKTPPSNAFVVWPDASIASAVDWTQRGLVAAGALALTVALARRWSGASAARRRSLTPVLAGGAATVLASVTVIVEAAGGHVTPLNLVLLGTLTAVPLAVLADMLRARLARSAVGDLVVELSADPAPADLRGSLARALHDPSLQLAYWLPEFETYADRSGRAIDVRREPSRTTTVVERGGRAVAALLHDPSLQREPALLDAVVAAAGIALENGRLESELRARVQELRQSRARIVQAAQSERRRLERDLHDGAQQRLVALSLQLVALERQLSDRPGAVHQLEEARRELDLSLRELRELARGIHPAIVTDRGLSVALDALVSRATVPVELAVQLDARPSEAVEVAVYYLVSESLTNIAKHARASSARVEVAPRDGLLVVEVSDDGIGGAASDGGSGLRGLTDRVEALGGRLRVSSPSGGGTRLRAEIPFA
jgi:signal transduction histidine kinase